MFLRSQLQMQTLGVMLLSANSPPATLVSVVPPVHLANSCLAPLYSTLLPQTLFPRYSHGSLLHPLASLFKCPLGKGGSRPLPWHCKAFPRWLFSGAFTTRSHTACVTPVFLYCLSLPGVGFDRDVICRVSRHPPGWCFPLGSRGRNKGTPGTCWAVVVFCGWLEYTGSAFTGVFVNRILAYIFVGML